MEAKNIKKNDVLNVEFTDLSFKGLGVAKIEGLPVFVEGALPGEEGKIRIVKREQRFAFGELISLAKKSSDRIEVREKNVALDSTVPLQHLRYEKQLEFKTKIVRDALSKVSSLKEVAILDTLASEAQWHYRNKTSVPVRLVDKKMVTGVFETRSRNITPIDNFRINDADIDEIVNAVRDILIEFNEKPYDDRTHTGNIRHIIVRKGYHTDEVMVIIVTRSKSLFPVSKIVPAIQEKVSNVVSIIHNVNGQRTANILGDTSTTLFGEDYYKETILGKTFEVPAHSFLQVNTRQTEVLYQKVLEFLELQGTETVLDAYCGIGTISLNLADKAKNVIGVEVMQEAVDVAKVNAKNNGIENVSFECGLVEDVVEGLNLSPDVIVVDPPRKGLEASFIDTLISYNASKMVYVSCNPTTLARDLEKLVASGYQVSEVQPVDMFPQTVHVETVVLLERN